MKTVSVLLSLIAVLAFVGCSDNSAPGTAPTPGCDIVSTPLSKSVESGALIVRWELQWTFAFFDPEAGVTLLLGINDLAKACAGGMAIDTWSVKDILLPDADPEMRRMLRHMAGDDVGAIVWNGNVLGKFCMYPPLAVGTANVVRTENDFYSASQDNNNSNAYGFKANGRLVTSDGQVYHLNFLLRAVWDGLDPASRKVVLKIQLTPSGGS